MDHKPPSMELSTWHGQAPRAVKGFRERTEAMGLFLRRRSLSYRAHKDRSASTGSHLRPEKAEPHK